MLFWSIVAAVCLAVAILLGGTIIGLVDHRGSITVSPSEAEAFNRVVAQTRYAESGDPNRPVTLRGTGLLPTAWQYRETAWGNGLLRVWQTVSTLQTSVAALLTLLTCLLCVLLVRLFALSHVRMVAARIATEVALGLRRSIHRQAMRLGPSDLEGHVQQEMSIDLFTNTVSRVRDGLSSYLSKALVEVAVAVLMLVPMLVIDWRLALQCLVPLAAIAYLLATEQQRRREIRRLAEAEADAELRPLADALRKTRLARAYNMEEFEHRQFQSRLERYSDEVLRGWLGETWSLRSSRMLVLVFSAAVVFLLVARTLTDLQPLSAGLVWTMASALFLFGLAGVRLWDIWRTRRDCEIAADRVYRYLAEAPEVSQAVGAKFLNPVSSSIIFESVSYRYNERTLLDRLDLRITAGTRLALVSDDPLVARAVAYLLPRFIEPHSGRVLFDSEDIAWATLESLRAEAVYVGASDPFFTGTVFENLSCGESKYTLQDVTEACKTAHAHKAIAALPNGYETQIGEHGESIPVGLAFRIGLARAVLRNPAVLIIEEPTTRLHEDDKALIDDAYQRVLKGRTAILLPTRLSTIRSCQQIAFLGDGTVIAQGPHEELVRSNEPYRHWEYVHFSSFSRQQRSS
ncbi:MAG: ABC transporter ATP-binding protein [Planctomycetaceae bacterium]